MPLRINFNYEALTAQRGLMGTQFAFHKAVEQLSTGLRINRAADDAAGLAVSEKLKNQVRGLNQAQRNAQDGVSLLQTAEGGLDEIHSILARMRELAVQAANDTLQASDRDHLQDEVNALVSEIDRIANSTQFNKIVLLNGSATGLVLHIGANQELATNSGANELAFSIDSVTTSNLGSLSGTTVATAINSFTVTYADGQVVSNTLQINQQSAANNAIALLDGAIEKVSTVRGSIGALQNRLEHTITNLGVGSENTAAANSRIRDTDVAAAVAEMTRTQILQQAAMAVLAQANQAPQAALQLLR
jgi:flagellin